ncbi:MAG: hypothetical protein Q8S22_08190 [Eubacteriales bacterium]|nr:hypothetical protein [Eubacteriales bacterium]
MRTLILTGPDHEGQQAVARALKQSLAALGDSVLIVGALALLGPHPSLSQTRTMELEALPKPRSFAFLSAHSSFLRARKRKSLVYEVNERYAEHLRTLLKEGEFDAVLCLHRYPAEAVTHLRKTFTFSARCCYVSCDFACVPFLEETTLDHFFIADESFADAYLKRGIAAKKIVPAGIPLPADWFSKADRADARALLNLPQGVPCYFIPNAADPEAAVTALLDRITNDSGRICVVAPDGAPPRSPFVARFAGDIRVAVLAPEERLPLYRAACDILLTAPSGAISAAAAVSGMPLVHLPSNDAFEAQTARFFSSRNMSLSAETYETAAALALKLVKNAESRETMRASQQNGCVADASQRIVRFLHEGRV